MSEADELPGDAELVAYLDGEMPAGEAEAFERRLAGDTALQRRLAELAPGAQLLRRSFDALLANAPAAQLESGLAKLTFQPRQAARSPLRRAAIAIAAALLLALGFCIGNFVVPANVGGLVPDENGEWRQVVAEYMTLFTPSTLATAPRDQETAQRELDQVAGDGLGLPLSLSQVALPDLSYRRAELLAYEGKPLAQLAYLDPNSGPVALCIIDDADPANTMSQEKRAGFNIVFWGAGHHEFMLIGKAPADQLRTLATNLRSQIPS